MHCSYRAHACNAPVMGRGALVMAASPWGLRSNEDTAAVALCLHGVSSSSAASASSSAAAASSSSSACAPTTR